MKKYALDTNCFINAVNKEAPSHGAIHRILLAFNSGKLSLRVSLQTLQELEQKDDAALEIARKLEILPHWPIGAWSEQVGTWSQQEGTWHDIKINDETQLKLKVLAKSGTGIRDRGAYIDALLSGMDGFL